MSKGKPKQLWVKGESEEGTPLGVIVIGILMILSGIIWILSGLATLEIFALYAHFLAFSFTGITLFLGVAALFWGILNFIVAFGLFNLRPWSYGGTWAITAIGLILAIIGLDAILLIIGVIILAYLYTQASKFREEPEFEEE